MTRQPNSNSAAKKPHKAAGKPKRLEGPAAAINPRARSIAAVPNVKRDRIFRIAATMATGEWNKGRAKELREEWGLTASYLRFMAAEASRLLEFTTNDRVKLVTAGRLRLQQIAAQDGPDRVQALRTLFEQMGELRKRVEVSGPDGRDIPVGVTAKVVVLPAEEPEDEPGEGGS